MRPGSCWISLCPQGAEAPNRKIPYPQRLRSRWTHFFWDNRLECNFGDATCRGDEGGLLFGKDADEHAYPGTHMLSGIHVGGLFVACSSARMPMSMLIRGLTCSPASMPESMALLAFMPEIMALLVVHLFWGITGSDRFFEASLNVDRALFSPLPILTIIPHS